MAHRLFQLFLLIPLLFVLSTCGKVASSEWLSFSDSLDQGSKVVPSQGFVSTKGIVDVRITKAKDPQWVPDTELDYPYAGIMMKFRRAGNTLDITKSDGITITYMLDGMISMRLIQKNIPPGQEYHISLPRQETFKTVSLTWDLFSQPSWVETKTAMELTNITGIMFTNSSPEESTAHLRIKTLEFPNWENPYAVKNMIRRIDLYKNEPEEERENERSPVQKQRYEEQSNIENRSPVQEP